MGIAMKTVLGHAAIVLSLMYAVFFSIDRVNNSMNFIDNDLTKFLLLALAAVSVANACFLLSRQRSLARKKAKKRVASASRRH